MRKYLTFIIFIIVCSMVSCNSGDHGESELIDKESYLSEIYENEVASSTSENAIPTVEIYVESDAPSEIALIINGEEKHLTYHDSIYRPVGPQKRRRYLIDGDENKMVLIEADGSICALAYEFDTIDISSKSTPEEVLPLLKNVLSKYVDISEYENIDMPENMTENADEGYISYQFTFYNAIGEYRTDYIQVGVLPNGAVSGLRIYDVKYDGEIILNIDKDLEKKFLDLKLDDMYTTETTKYKTYDATWSPHVVVYNDELYIEYYVSARYTKGDSENLVSSFIHRILIPVDMISSK